MVKQPSKGRKTPPKTQKTAPKTRKSTPGTKKSTTTTRKRSVAAKKVTESKATYGVVDSIPPEHRVATPTPPVKPAAASEPAAPAPKPAQSSAIATAAPKPSHTSAATPAPKRGGFFPMLLGGMIAAGIGFFAAYILMGQSQSDMKAELAAQADTIAALQNQVGDISATNAGAIEETQDRLTGELGDTRAALTSQFDTLDARLTKLESLPTGDGTMSERAIAAYEADLQALRDQMAEMRDGAAAQLDEARAEAASIEANAAAAARAAAGRAALARIQTSLDSGEPIGAALSDLENALQGPAPDALIAAADGIPTLVSLQEGFPALANAALAAARQNNVAGEETSGFSAFLKNQFDVRSTTPREGNSADAVLSRAEAAVKQGRLSDALAEIAALPEEARVEMTDWLASAESRAAATAAVDMLTTTFNDN